MKILNVAEKPSVAKSISHIMNRECRTERGKSKYCPNIHFTHNCEMIFTSVLGHIYTQEFAGRYGWKECDPCELFVAPIEKRIAPDMKDVAENITRLARGCDMVAIWTDCDREGENIAMQIKQLVVGKQVRRARFSAVSAQEVEDALNHLVEINEKESDAVDARMELDLRIGSAFTRLQTLALNKSNQNVVSFGPCQIPTLNFVVERHNRIVRFIPEQFYSLQNCVRKEGIESHFKWVRGNLYDRNCAAIMHQMLCNGTAKIVEKKTENKTKQRPLPLRTVEFQKVCGSYHRIPGHRLMAVAEKLYNSGFISYPRTETDSFPSNFNYSKIRKVLSKDSGIGRYAEQLSPVHPRKGRNNDQAHSPIYPLKAGSGLAGEERKVYEFVARHFLACISEDAKGVETEYMLEIENDELAEQFTCKGLKITEQNYLEIYPFDKWAESRVGNFRIGELVRNNIEITSGSTTPPEYITEAELIALMDKNGIGTDATIHEHIQKIQTRMYAWTDKSKIKPTELGVNLIEAYRVLELNINEPTMRKHLEMDLREICEGRRAKEEIVNKEIEKYKEVYNKLNEGIEIFKSVLECKREELMPKENQPNRETNRNKNTKRGGNERREPGRENGRVTRRESTGEVIVKCTCGYEAVKKKAKTEANSGREFYCCKKSYKKCKYFKWADEVGHNVRR